MSGSPTVTVLMPAYNRERYLRGAIDSVLAQTYADFELIVVDDGSDDETVEIAHAVGDPRIRVVEHAENRGVAEARNTGVQAARGRYVAILDSDDYALPTRLALQAAYLAAHPRCAVLGTWARQMDEHDAPSGLLVRPTDPRTIRARLPFAACFSNTTVMARTEVLQEHPYRVDLRVAEDLDLWARLAPKYEMANLPRFLTHYRHHREGVSKLTLDFKREKKIEIAGAQLADLGIEFTREELELHFRLRNTSGLRPDDALLAAAEAWLLKLRAANQRSHVFPEPEWSEQIGERWLRLCWAAGRRSPQRWLRFFGSSLATPGAIATSRYGLFLLRHGWEIATGGRRPR